MDESAVNMLAVGIPKVILKVSMIDQLTNTKPLGRIRSEQFCSAPMKKKTHEARVPGSPNRQPKRSAGLNIAMATGSRFHEPQRDASPGTAGFGVFFRRNENGGGENTQKEKTHTFCVFQFFLGGAIIFAVAQRTVHDEQGHPSVNGESFKG